MRFFSEKQIIGVAVELPFKFKLYGPFSPYGAPVRVKVSA
jgi:hypothetical protein